MSSAWGNVFATAPSRVTYAVTTIAALRTLSPPNGDATVNVAYGVAAGDHLGGDFFWNATDASADNGTTIIAPAAGGVGRWNKE